MSKDMSGFKELEKFFKKAGKESKDKSERAVKAGGEAIQKIARENVSVDQGQLRQSIISTNFTAKDGFGAEIGPTVKHGPFIEFGTKPHFPSVEALERWAEMNGMAGAGYAIAKKISKVGTKEKPYLVPAFNKVAPKVLKSLEKILKGIE